MFKVLFRALVIASMALAGAQVADAQPVLDDVNFSQLPTCNAAAEGRTFWVKDNSAASGNCAAGGGSKAICTCDGSNWVVQSGSGGSGSNSFETINMPSGTNPVADSSTDTLNITCTAPLVCTGTAGTDTADWTIDSATVSRCARFDGSGMLVAAAGDCANGDTDTNSSVILDLGDNGSSESIALEKVATTNDRHGMLSEPTNDKALFNFAPIDDLYLAGPVASPGTPDDEFESGTLDAKWTAVGGCSSGTADPYVISGSDFSTYDLSFRSGWLTIQVADDTNDVCQFYQAYTIPDGSAVYVKVAHPGSLINNSMQFDFAINSSTTSPSTGTYLSGVLDAEQPGARLFASGSSGSDYIGATYSELVAYFAISRVGTEYYVWASLSGGTNWHLLKTMTIATPPTHLWIGVRIATNYTAGARIRTVHIDWLRLGDDNPYTPGW